MTEESPEERAEQKKRFRLQDALHLQTRVQEMVMLDADDVRKDAKMLEVLRGVRDNLNKLVDGAGGEGKDEVKDAVKAAREVGVGG